MPNQNDAGGERTPSKAMVWSGWGLTALVGALLLFSAVMKFAKPPEVLEEFTRLGYLESTILGIAITELLVAVVYLIPRTSILGAILLTGYLGGAVATHLRVGDAFIPPIIVGAIAWLGIFLRDKRLRDSIPFRRG